MALGLMVYGFLSLFLALGVFLMASGAKDVWHGIASRGWPRVEGVVVQRQIEAARGSTASGEILVQYLVKGRTYVTDTMYLGKSPAAGDAIEAELLRLRYPVGRRLAISHHPADPSIAVISPAFQAASLALPGVGFACALVALMFSALFHGSTTAGGDMALGVGLFAAVFMLGGLCLLIGGGVTLYRAHASAGWPAAEGEFVRRNEEDGSEATGQVYRFQVHGQPHYSSRRSFGPARDSGPEGPHGESEPKLQVRYDPSDPDVAVLETGITNETYWLPGAGAAVFLFGLAVLRIIVPAMKRDSDAAGVRQSTRRALATRK